MVHVKPQLSQRPTRWNRIPQAHPQGDQCAESQSPALAGTVQAILSSCPSQVLEGRPLALRVGPRW